jgi:hypothetical protein
MAILLCRKLLPDYQAFSATHGWGDPRVLEEAIQCCEAVQAGVVNEEGIDPLFERLYGVTPDTDAYIPRSGICRLIILKPYKSILCTTRIAHHKPET